MSVNSLPMTSKKGRLMTYLLLLLHCPASFMTDTYRAPKVALAVDCFHDLCTSIFSKQNQRFNEKLPCVRIIFIFYFFPLSCLEPVRLLHSAAPLWCGPNSPVSLKQGCASGNVSVGLEQHRESVTAVTPLLSNRSGTDSRCKSTYSCPNKRLICFHRIDKNKTKQNKTG